MRIALAASFLLLASLASATPFAVSFTGRVTAVGDNAPASFLIGDTVASFSVGEEVTGGFLFASDDQPAVAMAITSRNTDPFAGIAPDSPDQADGVNTRLAQLTYSGGIFLATESGFSAADLVSEYLWVSNSFDRDLAFAGEPTSSFSVSTGRLLADLLPGGARADALTNLLTFAGPATTGFQIDLEPGTPELTTEGDFLVEATFASLTAPNGLRPTGGSILFGDDNLDLLTGSKGSVEFEITEFSIVPQFVPEPHTLVLLVSLAPLAIRRC